jgi:hypothetical protein
MKEFGKPLLCLILLMALAANLNGQVRKYHISGTALDSITREPIPFMTVFVPNSTISTLTDEKGKFYLDNIPFSTTELAFSHLNYGTKLIWLASQLIRGADITVYFPTKVYDIRQVEIEGKLSKRAKADRDYFLKVFYQYFLGDTQNNECQLTNPQVLRFRKDGSRIYASASSPLIIHNFLLGYDIQYFMDYFLVNDIPSGRSMGNECFYSFQGVALYKEMKSPDPALEPRWIENRKKHYVGSLRNFLSCLYQDSLYSNHYRIFKTSSSEEFITPPQSSDGKKNKKANQLPHSSVFFYNSATGQPGELYYSLLKEINLKEFVAPDPSGGNKILSFSDSLLVMKDTKMTPALEDDETTLFVIGDGQIHFRKDGDYQVYNSDLHWTSLDSQKKIIKLLPLNYQPEKITQ